MIPLNCAIPPENRKAASLMKTKDIVTCSFLAAILLVVQIMLGFLPNVELVSLLIIIYTLTLGRKTLAVIYLFALFEGLLYGFGIWWVMYLYVWTILYMVVRILRKNNHKLIWAVTSGIFGLSFGALCSLPYAAAGGLGAGIAWWISGIPFDLLHGISNFLVVLLFFTPILSIVQRLIRGDTQP